MFIRAISLFVLIMIAVSCFVAQPPRDIVLVSTATSVPNLIDYFETEFGANDTYSIEQTGPNKYLLKHEYQKDRTTFAEEMRLHQRTPEDLIKNVADRFFAATGKRITHSGTTFDLKYQYVKIEVQ